MAACLWITLSVAAGAAEPSPPSASPGIDKSATTPQPAATTPAAPAVPAGDAGMPVEDLPITPGLASRPEAGRPADPVPTAETKPDPNLPHDLSPLAMFLQADLVVKSVMIGLALASILTWTVGLYKTIELLASRARVRRDLRAIGRDASLAAAAKTLENRKGLLPAFIDVATLELRLSADAPDKSGIKERVASRLERIESAAIRVMNRGTGILATIGATAPFIGLFGTVWGIMNSFIGISKSQTTNLAVVAPGIAEALQATAIGLVAAIPAVIIYNLFARALGVYRALAGDASAEVMRLVSRDLDRVSSHRHVRAAE